MKKTFILIILFLFFDKKLTTYLALSQHENELKKIGAGKIKIGDNGRLGDLMNVLELCAKNYNLKLQKPNFFEVLYKIFTFFSRLKVLTVQ